MNKLIQIAILLLLTSCGTLTPGGAYKSNKILFEADQSAQVVHTILNAFFEWEETNRVALWNISTSIKGSADVLRVKSKELFALYFAARDIYALFPNKQNQAALENIVNELNKLSSSAQSVITIKP